MKTMKSIIMILIIPMQIYAGDFASGDIRYSADFSNEYEKYELTSEDDTWVKSLKEKLSYTGDVIHFVKTDLVLYKRGEPLQGKIYQSLKTPDQFYILEGDVMFNLNSKSMTSPGSGGFSVHAPTSKIFIACLNCQTGISYGYFSHFNLGFSKAWWWAGDTTRL